MSCHSGEFLPTSWLRASTSPINTSSTAATGVPPCSAWRTRTCYYERRDHGSPHMNHPPACRARTLLLIGLVGLLLSGCGINTIPTYEETAKAKWSDVQNQYQRRADLIPNLVETVKGYATQERQVLTEV